MSSTGLNRLVYDIADREDIMGRDRQQLHEQYGVGPEDVELIVGGDLRALHERGLHPLLVCKVGFMHGLSAHDMGQRLGS